LGTEFREFRVGVIAHTVPGTADRSVLVEFYPLATEYSITHSTAKAWISVLEASYLIILLRPYHVNFGKRLVKTSEHRMEKARRLGIKSLPAYRLGVEQHLKFLTSSKAYAAYVKYWNGKLQGG
jgi:hypothetical protein